MSFLTTLERLLGDPNEKELRRLRPLVTKVKDARASGAIAALTLEDLPKKTEELRTRLADGISPDAILPEAFAVVLRASELLLGQKVLVGRQEFLWDMVPFDVQLLGGIVLHRGCIAEMKTGEGKTLVCTMPVYLNALTGKGVHVVTVNDYLARRDSHWMGLLYKALGLSVGTVVHGVSTEERRAAYACDVTYGTNNEFGFDYLRDNMASSLQHQVQRSLHYAIVDEVDSILVDEARTPLIISQPAEESTAKYVQYAHLVRELQQDVHFTKDEKQRTAVLTEEGIRKMEGLLGLENIYTERGFEEVHHIEQALRAYAIYQRDVDYVVKPSTPKGALGPDSGQEAGEVIIVDEFTGRLMPGRRYSHGLHQAIEAKEGVEVQRESRTLATITFQNYFRLYEKLAGMTGTAKTEEEEFESIYRLRVVAVPTHRSMIREDKADAVYRTVVAKFKAVAAIAQEKHARGQPVLIGTTSIEKSEVMSKLLAEVYMPHQVLNAKHHEQEAEIVAKAGQRGAVTIATNMAGRGTDIKLGEGVTTLGGLCILGTERHEARRIDNQLRGRAGRQGDPGESQFFVSMEDNLMRLFGGDRLKSMMQRLNVPDDVPLQNRMVSRSIESAQKRVEGHNFDIRRHVLQYDNVMNKHREIIYKRRQRILRKLAEVEGGAENAADLRALHEDVLQILQREAQQATAVYAGSLDSVEWHLEEIQQSMVGLHPDIGKALTVEALRKASDQVALEYVLTSAITSFYAAKCTAREPALVAQAERIVTLRSIDVHWMDHIDTMAHLREQVAFAGFAQRDPLIEYQDQGFRLFAQLLAMIDATIARTLLQVDFAEFAPQRMLEEAEEELESVTTNIEDIEEELRETGVGGTMRLASEKREYPHRGRDHVAPPQSERRFSLPRKVGRNDPCPCGSGKKYKKCHALHYS